MIYLDLGHFYNIDWCLICKRNLPFMRVCSTYIGNSGLGYTIFLCTIHTHTHTQALRSEHCVSSSGIDPLIWEFTQAISTVDKIQIKVFHVWDQCAYDIFKMIEMIFTKHQQNKWLRREAGESKTSRVSRKIVWCKTWKWSQNGKWKKQDALKLILSV